MDNFIVNMSLESLNYNHKMFKILTTGHTAFRPPKLALILGGKAIIHPSSFFSAA